MSGAPNDHDVHDLDPQLDSIRNIAPATAPDFAPERVVPSEDGWMDPAPEAAHSSMVEPSTGFTPKEAGDTGPPDSCPAVGFGPRTPSPPNPVGLR